MSMKLWQLDSILCANHGRERSLSIKVAAAKEEWYYLKPLFNEIFECNDRNVLDTFLPDDFVRQVLDESILVCYKKHSDRTITSYPSEGREAVSALNIYLQYGGEILVRIFERGIAGDAGELQE